VAVSEATVAAGDIHESHPLHHSRMPTWTQRFGRVAAFAILAPGAVYAASRLVSDLRGVETDDLLPFALLGVALLIALGFALGFAFVAQSGDGVGADAAAAITLSGALYWLFKSTF
jgi:hypothetical protein